MEILLLIKNPSNNDNTISSTIYICSTTRCLSGCASFANSGCQSSWEIAYCPQHCVFSVGETFKVPVSAQHYQRSKTISQGNCWFDLLNEQQYIV